MFEINTYTHVPWGGTYPTDVTSPVPSQRPGTADSQRTTEPKPSTPPVFEPSHPKKEQDCLAS